MSGDCAVVIPLFNGARWILQALDTVLAQTRPPAEVVVVDDVSTDDSPARVEAYGRGVLLLRGEKGGPSGARNLGLARTRSPLVAFMDQDDVWHPRHLELLAGALARRPEAPAATAGVREFPDGRVPILAPEDAPDGAYDPWAGFPVINGIPCPSAVLVRREALEAAGGWHPRFTGASDYHLWLRLSVGEPFVRSVSATVGRRLHFGSDLQVKITADPLGRLRVRCEAAKDALERRLARVGDARERDRLSNRLPLAACALELARSFVEKDRAGLAKAALDAERILAEEPESLRWGLFALLEFSVCPLDFSLEGRRKKARFLEFLRTRWPSGASFTRRSLLAYVEDSERGG